MNQRPVNDELTNLALIGVIRLAAFAGVLRIAETISAFLTGMTQPKVGPAGGLGVLAHPLDPGVPLEAPGPNPAVYWIVTTLLLCLIAGLTWWVVRRVLNQRQKAQADPRRRAGTASAGEITQAASRRTLLRKTSTLRPSLQHPELTDIGYLLGSSRGRQVWATVEDSILLIGPPRTSSPTPAV